jgi:hypothetical protein
MTRSYRARTPAGDDVAVDGHASSEALPELTLAWSDLAV